MGILDSAQDVLGRGAQAAQGVLDKGVTVAKGAVSGVAVEQQPFMKAFVRLCTDGWDQGWHERNGGNLTYRLTDEQVGACRPFFYDNPSSWVSMGVQADNLRGAFFATTGSGRYMRNVKLDPAANVGIVEINDAGDAWRIVWGLKDGGVTTSEFTTHFMNHSVRVAATDGACRVIYHAHPQNVIALSFVMPLDARTITRALRLNEDLLSSFPDADAVSGYAVEAMQWAVSRGLISGDPASDGTLWLRPRDGATRAQIAKILWVWLGA